LALTTRMSLPLTTRTSSSALSAADFLEPTGAVETALGGVVFQQIGQVVGRHDVADGDHIEGRAEQALLDEGAEDEAADAAETIDCDFNCHAMTNPALVAARVAAETQQASIMNSFPFKLRGKPITANEIDDLLQSSTDLAERRAVWEASKESGPALKPGLVKLRDLRNGVARELGHADYFALQMAAYGMTARKW
jgi:hypothetical protein